MEFSISPASGVPIYQQLTEQISAAIARGGLRPNERLPSVRELSERLVVNPNTIARSYTELEREGALYTRPGLGVFVAEARQPATKKARRERLIPALDRVLIDAVRLGSTLDEMLELVEERSKQFQWQPAAVA